jgi:hypothetical protein
VETLSTKKHEKQEMNRKRSIQTFTAFCSYNFVPLGKYTAVKNRRKLSLTVDKICVKCIIGGTEKVKKQRVLLAFNSEQTSDLLVAVYIPIRVILK